MKKTDKTITTSEDFTKIAGWLVDGDWFSSTMNQNILTMLNDGAIEVKFNKINGRKNEWDGTLYINLLTPLTTQTIVNSLIARANADEISMETDTKIRLWWD
jgi:hypothetical protein